MWQNYNNYSCMPTSSGPCSTAGYPIYVVQAREASDVKAAVDFARTKNVRLNIKSTGHDFLGRSVQPYSLSIWTHALKATQWYETSFAPKGCNIVINGPAVTVGSGSQWSELNSAATARGVALVSGAFGSVSVGGFLANGGHGRLSAKYGFGADMVLQIELVTAAGEIITANECQNQDYFWAMRGGGGSTYGVVLSYTLQAIPTFPTARYSGTLTGWDEMAFMHSQWSKIAMAGAGGYIRGYPGRSGEMTYSVTMPNATSAELRRIIDPIMANFRRRGGTQGEDPDDESNGEGMDEGGRNGGGLYGGQRGGDDEGDGEDEDERRIRPRAQDRGKYSDFATWGEAEGTLHTRDKTSKSAPFPGMGTNKIIASWLYSSEAVGHPQLKEALRGALSQPEIQYLNDATMGVGSQNPPYIRGGGNAVNPAMRRAIMRPAAELQWSGSDMRTLAAKKQDARRFVESLRSIDPQGGTYANEADPDTPDWQHAFWGSNYERLFEIKSRVDPQGVFYCRSCVGSELFEDYEGVLCRK